LRSSMHSFQYTNFEARSRLTLPYNRVYALSLLAFSSTWLSKNFCTTCGTFS